MADEAVDDEESIGILMLVAPLHHPVVGHDLLETLVSDAAFEADEGLCFICCPILKKFSIINSGSNLFSFTVLCCDERATDDIRCINSWQFSTVAHSVFHG